MSDIIDSYSAIVAHYEYAAFGATIAQGGDSAVENPWRFSSEYADDELGCDYYNYREYEPLSGRWMNRDPLEERNSYAFVENFPETNDVLGL